MNLSRIKLYPFILVLSVVFLASCTADRKPEADERFESLAGNFVEQYLNLFPEHATQLGDHRFDDRLDDYSAEGREKARVLFQQYLDSLKQLAVPHG